MKKRYAAMLMAAAMTVGSAMTSFAGWQSDVNGWWWQNEDGSWIASDWRLINHHHYLFGANGYIRTGWHRWNPDTKQVDPADGSGDWYYLQEDGELQGACWHSRSNGAMEVWHVDK